MFIPRQTTGSKATKWTSK